MADEEELYFANLDEFVNDEDKIVTYKWLSRTLSVPVNKAKQMLYAFVQKQKASKSVFHLNITYIIGGRSSVGGENVHRYVITQDENLEETKKTFSPVTSLHIYSIQKCKLKDSNSLYTVDYDIQQQHNNDNNRWSHIHCAAATPLADKGVNRGAHRVNGLANGEKCPTTKMVNGSGEPETSHKGSSNLATEQRVKMSGSKAKKGQMSALEMFAAKPSSSKTDKKLQKNSEKQQDTKDAKGDESKAGQAKTDSNKAGSMKSFFGKTTTVKKPPEKPATTEHDKEAISTKTETVLKKQNQNVENVNKKKRELSSEDEEEDPLPSKISKAIKSDSTEKKVVKGDKQKAQKTEEKHTEAPKSSKVGRKKAVIHESDEEPEEKPKKKRKRMKELPKEDSSDDEQIVTNAESDKKLPSDQGSSRSESPLPQQQPRQTENDTPRRRKRKRQLKSKTYMDNEGFMVTEKVWESESTDASDEELQITNPPVTEKKPSPAKKIIKKTHADMKNKSAKQASLTSFFKKS